MPEAVRVTSDDGTFYGVILGGNDTVLKIRVTEPGDTELSRGDIVMCPRCWVRYP